MSGQSAEGAGRMKNNWVNTILITMVIGMLAWFFTKGFDKMDTLNTTSIETRSKVSSMELQMVDFKNQLGQMVTRGEMHLELQKRDETIAELTRALNALKRAP